MGKKTKIGVAVVLVVVCLSIYILDRWAGIHDYVQVATRTCIAVTTDRIKDRIEKEFYASKRVSKEYVEALNNELIQGRKSNCHLIDYVSVSEDLHVVLLNFEYDLVYHSYMDLRNGKILWQCVNDIENHYRYDMCSY